MIVLRTLGEVRLDGSSASLAGRRKELTLAAFLARRSPRPCHRTELASLLWETRDDTRARQSLRQVLLELKRVLGDGLHIDGDQVKTDSAHLTLDVTDLLVALEQGREADAVALWRGDFLAGMDDVGGETYRVWLETEREDLRRRIKIAFANLARRAGDSGDWSLAVEWSERWVAAFPFEENGNRSLVEALHRAGRNDEARGRYENFATRLRAELGEAPSLEFSRSSERLVRETPGRRAPGSAALFSPDLAGRGPELAELFQAWDAVRGGAAVVVLLEGESGSGKTRLAEEFLRRLTARGDPAVVLRTPVLAPGELVPLAAARTLFGPLANAPGISGSAPPTLKGIAPLIPAIGDRFPFPANPDAVPLDLALADALAAVAEEQPVVLLLDHLELIDQDSQGLLGRITPRLAGRILVLATSLGEADSSPSIEAIRTVSRLRRLKLQPLSPQEIETLLASMLELEPGDRSELASRLALEGGGNPFYVVEMTSALVDDGLLTTNPDGGWRLTPGEGWSLPLPTSIRSAVAQRLEHLSPTPKLVAEAAAVVGRRFDRTIVGQVSGLDPAALDQALEVLIAGRLVREAVGATGDLEFRHELTARIAYDRIPPAARARLHRAAADAFERSEPLVAGAREAVIYHRSRSGRRFHLWYWAVASAALLATVWVAVARRSPEPVTAGSRVVVASFENQTGDSTLNAAGQFMADWITQSIAQSGIVPVVDVRTALTSERIVGADTAKRGVSRLHALAVDAGAGRVVWGTYYLRGDSLVVQANLSDAASGQILRALDPVRVAPPDPSRAVAQVSQSVLGALAVLYNSRDNALLREVKHPPLYQAYQVFMEGMDLLVRYQSTEAAARFARAHVIDSTFDQALVWEADAYEQIAEWAKADSVLQLATRTRDRLGNYEQLFLDYRRAELAGDFGRALDYARELARIAPGSEATFLQGATAIRLNRPKEALKALAQVDPEKGFLKGWDGFWGYPMQAHMMLNQLDQALADAREGRRRYPDSRQAVHQEVTVLSAQGNEPEVNRLLDVEDGLPESPGLPLQRTIRAAATIFRGYGFDSASRRMAERVIAELPNKDTSSVGDENRLILVEALYLVDRYAEARPIVSGMAHRLPNDMTWEGYSGLLAARLGHRTEADSIMRKLAGDRRPFAFGRGALWRARIEAALGHDQEAIALLRTGLAQGLNFDQAFTNMTPDFRGLEKYPEYRELFRPKG